MATTLSTKVQVNLNATYTNPLDLTNAEAAMALQKVLNLTNGTGSGQANIIWSDQRTIAASTTEDIDLAGGGLTDPFGVTFAPVKVKALLIYASSSNTNSVVLFGDANSVPFLGTAATTITLQPGGLFLLTAPTSGYTVTAGTGDILQVANGGAGTTVTYDIVIVATNA